MPAILAAGSVFELAQQYRAGSCEEFDRIFRLRSGSAPCKVNHNLSERFGECTFRRATFQQDSSLQIIDLAHWRHQAWQRIMYRAWSALPTSSLCSKRGSMQPGVTSHRPSRHWIHKPMILLPTEDNATSAHGIRQQLLTSLEGERASSSNNGMLHAGTGVICWRPTAF